MPLLVEVIASHDCMGELAGLPDVVRRFSGDTGQSVELRVYRGWDAATAELPPYVVQALEEMRAGRMVNGGFFLNGRWLPISPHCAADAAGARAALVAAAGLPKEPTASAVSMRELESGSIVSSVLSRLQIDDNTIQELGAFCNQIDRVWFFDGHIKHLSVASRVDELQFAGYDVVKLVRIASQHPDLFGSARLSAGSSTNTRARIEDVRIRMLTADDLRAGRHPCIINSGRVDPASEAHRAACERYGGWAYVAEHGERTCGFLGVLPKDVALRDAAGFIPPADAPADATLLLTCFAGGGVFGGEYGGIGVATALVSRAVGDARARGYCCIEGNPHDPGIGGVLKRCGFAQIAWPVAGANPLRERAFYRLKL